MLEKAVSGSRKPLESSMSSAASGAIRKFLGAAFWGVGSFCVYWETQVFAAANRFSSVDLPIMGRCTEMEAVLFTLSLIWLPLLILHIIVHQHQRLGGERPCFPGAMGNLAVPIGLKWLRVLLFIALCLWPTFVHVFLTGRAFSHYVIVPSGFVKTTLDTCQWPAVRGPRLALYPMVRPKDAAWEIDGMRWWVNKRQEWVEVKYATQDPPNSSINVQTHYERVGITALPVQPIGFMLFGGLMCFSSLALLVNGLRKSATGPTKSDSA